MTSYDKLVDVEWVNDLIRGKKPPTYYGNKYVILEVSCGHKDYEQGHIPGALHLDTDEIECKPFWKFVSDDRLEQTYKDLGIDKDTLVIVYGKDISASARAVIALLRAGVEDVRLLDGGWQAWADGGYQVETRLNQPVPVDDFGAIIPAHPEYVIGISQLKELMKQDDFVLVSIRSWDEFTGKTSGYNYIEPKGEIRGAVWGRNANELRGCDGRMLSQHRIAELWKEWGITSDKKITFYCGTGWRGAEAWFYAYLMGWKNICLYDGGWFEWSRDCRNPVQIGDPRTGEDTCATNFELK